MELFHFSIFSYLFSTFVSPLLDRTARAMKRNVGGSSRKSLLLVMTWSGVGGGGLEKNEKWPIYNFPCRKYKNSRKQGMRMNLEGEVKSVQN
jgi:hypothetical protein